MKPNVIAATIGAELKRLREHHHLRQDDIARAARKTGLPWTRSVIVALEAGRRELTVDELVRLPLVLDSVGAVDADRFQVALESLGGKATLQFGGPPSTPQDLRASWATSLASTERVQLAQIAAFPFTRVGTPELGPAYEAAGGDLEQKVARRVHLDALAVALIAQATWGQSLTAERDRRVEAQSPAASTPRRALQALRGHVTRALLEEIEPKLAEGRQRLQDRRRVLERLQKESRRKKGGSR